jgi:hypothetical protein
MISTLPSSVKDNIGFLEMDYPFGQKIPVLWVRL